VLAPFKPYSLPLLRAEVLGGFWREVLTQCSQGDCSRAKEFLEALCPDKGMCVQSRSPSRRYAWIDKVIKEGVPDGRARLILYVISRYLVNIKGLSDEEALAEIEAFINASCKRHGNCSKIYKSWIKNVIKGVRRGGWKPWSLETMQKKDPELYSIVRGIIEGS
jgi:hypothetical protein